MAARSGAWILGVACMAGLLPTGVQAADRYVSRYAGADASQTGIPNDCASPLLPCRTIGHAIGRAGNFDVVKATYGTYTENLRFPVSPTTELTIEGGWYEDFSGRVADPAQGTVLGAAASGPVIDVDAYAGPAVLTVDGFTITGGDAERGGGVRGRSRNAPAYIWGGSLVLRLRSNRIVGNHGVSGGGISVEVEPYGPGQVESAAFLELRGNRIADNAADVEGGGLYAHTVGGPLTVESSDDEFMANEADRTSAIHVATEDPGTEGTVTISRTLVAGNPANRDAVLLLADVYSSLEATLVNDVIVANREANGLALVGDRGGAVTARLVNLTIADNLRGLLSVGDGPVDLEATNCIIAGNIALGDLYFGGATARAEVSHSNFGSITSSTGYVDGGGNFDADSRFVGGGDYHLRSSSPAIDAGICTRRICTTEPPLLCIRERVAPFDDFDGDPRPTPGTACDVGADEFVPEPNGAGGAALAALLLLARLRRRMPARRRWGTTAALGFVALLLPLAARAGTWASTTPGDTEVGDLESYASNALPEGFLEAQAELRGRHALAARAQATLGAEFLDQRNAHAHAERTRTFLVFAPGTATISWSVSGELRAAAVDATAVYQVNYSARFESDAWFGVIGAVGGLLSSDDPTGTVPVGESGSASYEFAEFQVGNTFSVTATLDAIVSSNDFVATGPAPSLSLEADFFDSAGMTASGGILEVPEPGPGLALAAGASLAALATRRPRGSRA